MTTFPAQHEVDDPELLVRLFETSVQSNGSRTALVADSGRVSFAELNDRAERIAIGLAACCRSAPIVGLNLAPSVDAVAAVLAIVKLGGAYVPLDPEHPKARHLAILASAKPHVVVSDDPFAGPVPSYSCAELMAAAGSLPSIVNHDPMLNIVFTSGSTGQPKGVRIPKRALLNRLAWMSEAHPFRASDVVLLHKPLALVAAAVEVFQGVLAGIPTIIASRATVRDPHALWELLRRESVSHVLASPAFWSGLLEDAEARGATLPALRFATTSAEAISVDLARRWLRRFPSVPFLNLYGSTECSSNAAAFDIRELRNNERVVPIGRPIRNVQTTIRDVHLAPVQPGLIGELCVSGACLASGYLDHDASRRSFVDDPTTGDRLLRTGDLAYCRDDGDIVLVGRADNRVNVNGYRIELEEVERALAAHPEISACAVALAPGRDGLVAYIVGRVPNIAQLRAHLEARLPAYMVPRHWVSLATLPRNPAGKLDRAALPPPSTDRPELGISVRPASSPLESLVAESWREILGFTTVGMDDDFHQYGGSSIQAARILARLFAAIRVRVPFERFMANATPAGVARLIENELGEAIANDIARAWSERRATGSAEAEARYSAVVVRAGLDVALELPATDRMPSFGQNSLWFFQRMRPDSATYNLAYAYRLRGPLRIDALRAALRDVVAANEALRSAFAEEHGQLCVTVTPEHACAFEVPVQAIADEQIQAFVDELARRPFDLAAAPLFRASIGTVGPEDNVVVLVVHHIVFDGWSRQLLLGQIAGSYWRRMRGDQESGIPASSSPTAFAELQRRWMNSNEGSSALAFWRQKLDNIRVPISIPTDYPRPEIHTHGGRKVSQRLDRELSARIDIFARELDSTPFATLLAAFKLLLKAKGVEDLIVGVPFVNREHPELESTIGYFVNMVAVRTEYEDSQSAAAVIAVETNAVNQAISRGSYPFDRLVSDLAVPRSLACNPVFQVVFNLLGDEWDRLSLFGIDAEGITVDNGGSQVDLSIAARRDSGGYTLTWEYCDALFAASTITAWQQEYVSILRALSADAATTVASAVAGVRRFAAEQQNKSNEAARSSRIDRLRKRSTTMLPGQAIARGALHRREINRAAVTVEQQVFDDIGFVKIEPSVRGLDPVAWAAEHTTALRGKLIECGGILFRGFDIHGDVAFRDFFHAVCGELNEYAHRVTKRTQVGDSFVYTSTDHPKTLDLSLHNETSYTKRWPAQIGFYCDVPSKEGGQTPIADSRKVLAALPEDLVTRFSERQLLYVRNSGNSIELPWQETFQTQSRLDVERYCKSQEMAFEWKPDGQLRTLQRCHVLARHPTTGDAVWFNQAHLMHRSAYPPGVIERMFAATADEDLPFNVFFGDRTPISDADIANINDSYQRNARCFDWQRGDVMILDNMLIAHGRRPFDGERRILVAMSGTITASDGALAPAERH